MFLIHILSVPALVATVEGNIPEFMGQLQTLKILQLSVDLLGGEVSMRVITNTIQGTQTLALLANLVHLFHVEALPIATEMAFPAFTFITTKLLQSIPASVGPKSGAFTQWHELLGWFSPSGQDVATDNLPAIKRQIHLLWSHRTVKILLGDNLKALTATCDKGDIYVPQPPGNSSLLKRALERTASKGSAQAKSWRKLGSTEVTRISLVAAMYNAALSTLAQLKLDILSGLCYTDTVLHDLWLLVASLGPICGLKSFLELLQVSGGTSLAPPLLLLLLSLRLHDALRYHLG
uniref:Putative ubiquitin-protein ligase e3b-like aedes albopictus n=1 Tax=Lutzomyia longipalpis TaxID=7200 RepID=A0A7G3B2A9_LUTLO